MSFFRKIGNIFKKGAQGTRNLFTKGAQEVKGAVTRSAESIGGSAGGLGGSMVGMELGGPLGAIVGGAIGSQLGQRTAQEIGKATAPKREQITTKPVHQNVNNLNQKINPIVGQYKNPRPILGQNGAGQRVMYNEQEKKNDLEKVRVKNKEEQKQKFV